MTPELNRWRLTLERDQLTSYIRQLCWMEARYAVAEHRILKRLDELEQQTMERLRAIG